MVAVGGRLGRGDRHVVLPKRTQIGNLWLTVANHFGRRQTRSARALARSSCSEVTAMRHVVHGSAAVGAALLAVSPVLSRRVRTRPRGAGWRSRGRARAGQAAGAVTAVAPDGTTALHWAARGGDAVALDLLIKAGADVNAANRYGVTPLALAVARRPRRRRAGAARRGRQGQGRRRRAARRADAADARGPHRQRRGDEGAARRGVERQREARRAPGPLPWCGRRSPTAARRCALLAEAGADLNVASQPHQRIRTRRTACGLNGLEKDVSYVGQTVLPKGGWTATMYGRARGRGRCGARARRCRRESQRAGSRRARRR